MEPRKKEQVEDGNEQERAELLERTENHCEGNEPVVRFDEANIRRTLGQRRRSAPEDGGEDEMVIVMEDGDVQLHPRTRAEIQRPLQRVTDVLREAAHIMSDGQPAPAAEDEEVLVDKVDVEYSPRKSHQPIEIIVRHSRVVSQSASDDESDGEDGAGRLRSSRCSTIKEADESGAEVPFPSPQPSTSAVYQQASSSGKKRTGHVAGQPFKKGHRRAWSMPNAKGDQMTLAVIQDDQLMEDGLHRRHIVRYKLFPHRHGANPGAVVDGVATSSRTPRMAPTKPEEMEMMRVLNELQLPMAEDDDNELEIEINEEEIVCHSESKGGARTIIKRFWEARWKAQNFDLLPEWLQDNEYLRTGHRPPLPSFGSCFKSIFALHTETGNIWTHMYGCLCFIGVAAWFLLQPSASIQWQEKLVFAAFFLGAVCCLGMSFAFHTVQCHSAGVGALFSKLDYTGITLLIVGSFVPWIYYGFYCRPQPMIIYLVMIIVLGAAAMTVSLFDKFAQPKFRPVRAGVFVAMGLSSIFPAVHLFVTDGFMILFEQASLHWLLLMGFLYLLGAGLYASRVPERCFPGKCDIWLFHMFVVIAAFVHFHGITEMAMARLGRGSCPEQLLERYGSETNPSFLGKWLGLDKPADVCSLGEPCF